MVFSPLDPLETLLRYLEGSHGQIRLPLAFLSFHLVEQPRLVLPADVDTPLAENWLKANSLTTWQMLRSSFSPVVTFRLASLRLPLFHSGFRLCSIVFAKVICLRWYCCSFTFQPSLQQRGFFSSRLRDSLENESQWESASERAFNRQIVISSRETTN